MAKQSFRKRLKRNRKFFLILVGIFILAEIILGFADFAPEYTYFFTKSDSGFWDEDPELFWLDRKKFKSNMKLIKDSGSDKLVYCFGGSIVRGDFASTNFCKELEKCLPDGYQVVNFATSGYTSHQSIILFERVLKTKKPILTIVSHGWNDVTNGPASDIQMAHRNSRLDTKVLYFLSHSRLVQILRRTLRTHFMPDPYSITTIPNWERRVETDQFHINLGKFMALAIKNNFHLLFMSQGMPEAAVGKSLEPYFEIMVRASLSSKKVHYLDVRPFLDDLSIAKFGATPANCGSAEAAYLFLDLCHLNDFAHEQVGRVLCDYLKTENLLP